jgi:hypothetical protein
MSAFCRVRHCANESSFPRYSSVDDGLCDMHKGMTDDEIAAIEAQADEEYLSRQRADRLVEPTQQEWQALRNTHQGGRRPRP